MSPSRTAIPSTSRRASEPVTGPVTHPPAAQAAGGFRVWWRRALGAVPALALALAGLVTAGPASADCVVLLHGLARTETSFLVMEQALTAEGYEVFRADYPSTEDRIARLAED